MPRSDRCARAKRRPSTSCGCSCVADAWGSAIRRQVRIDRYIVDFVCLSARLIVEVDRPTHELTEGQDALRTRRLEAQGYRVIRFSFSR
jgi:very-short-patch-repair endonuclease